MLWVRLPLCPDSSLPFLGFRCRRSDVEKVFITDLPQLVPQIDANIDLNLARAAGDGGALSPEVNGRAILRRRGAYLGVA